MSLDMFKAVIDGYADHLFDLQIISVHQGYWAGYYGRAKKPKNLESIVKKMFKAREKSSKKSKPYEQKKVPDVDVEAFLAMEQKRLSKMKI